MTKQREIRGQYERTLLVERTSINSDARTVELALSSEAPCERWYGIEILGHGPGEVDMSRLLNGAALLMDHNFRDQIGVVESARLDPDRVLRCLVRFSRSARGEEIFRDVVDGIRSKVSVGYQTSDYQMTKGINGAPDTYRFTGWLPCEASIVSVPADDSVGVGRSLGSSESRDITPTPPAPQAASTEVRMDPINTPVVAPVAAINPQAERVAVLQLRNLGEKFGIREVVENLINSDRPMSEIREAVMTELGKREAQPLPAPSAIVELNARERQQYSIGRAIAAHCDKRNGFEQEVSAEIAKKLGRDTTGFFVPTMTRANPPMDTATAAYGQKLVFTERGDFIDLLRAKLTILGMGAQFLPGLRGNIGFPRQTAANTLTWLAENPAAAATATALQIDLITMSPKQAVAQSSVTRNLVAQGTPDADQIINNDLALIHAIGIEVAAINGAGTPAPLGILGTSGIGSVAGGTNGLQPTYGNIVDLESAVANANADAGSMGYLTTPLIRGRLKQTQQFASTNGESVWDYLMGAYPNSRVTNNVPSTLTKGTASGICHAILFGNFNDLIIGEWGAFEVIPDPYTQAGKGVIVLTTNQLIDVIVRRPGSFSAMKDALQ